MFQRLPIDCFGFQKTIARVDNSLILSRNLIYSQLSFHSSLSGLLLITLENGRDFLDILVGKCYIFALVLKYFFEKVN